MSDCIFCRIINDEIPSDKVYEDEYIVAFHDVNPKATKHVLVIPKKHVASLKELTQEDEPYIVRLTLALSQIAEMIGLDHGFRTVINTGKGGGQEVYHLHYHIMGGNQIPGF